MIVLLATGVGVSLLGLLAIGFGIPISDTSFGNALLIAGVVILCTGVVLIGMWLAVREVAKLFGAQSGQPVRVAPAPRTLPSNPFAAPAVDPVVVAPAESVSASSAPASPPWTSEVAARAKPREPTPELPAAEPAEALAPAPDRPARRNLLFSTKRRDKIDGEQSPRPTALEAEPKVSFESAWPSPARTNGVADRGESATAVTEAPESGVDAAPQTNGPDDPAGVITTELPEGVTVVRSGTVDELAYTYYSDGSIEARIAGEKPIRFASLDALRAYVAQRNG
jgi:hypothetical protein